MQEPKVSGPVRANPRSRHTIPRDCGVLAIIALLCWGLEGLVNVATVFWGPDWNSADVQTRTTLEWLYLFVAPGTLLLAIVMRLLGIGLGKTSSLVIVVGIGWCAAIVVATIMA